jgi:CO/xanthine dehydrogenase FAD-binding subunit
MDHAVEDHAVRDHAVAHDVVGYHRPGTLSDALSLVSSDHRVPLAGGVHLRHDGGGDPTEVVDLQAVGLDAIHVEGDRARLGATVRLQAVVDDVRLPVVVREAARSEQPSTLRSLATVGGSIATASGDSLLLAALLVHDAIVRLASDRLGERTVALDALMEQGRGNDELIVEVVVQLGGEGALAVTGRTPRDTPIVGAVARRAETPDGAGVAVALCGVGMRPVLVPPEGVAAVTTIDDHRATASYRRHLAEVLTARVLEDLS